MSTTQMTKMRKFAAALVLGLVMCLALFTTGAFAQSAHSGYGYGYNHVSVSAVAVAHSENNGFFGNGFGNGFFGGGLFGGGLFGGGLFGGGSAFAHSSVHICDYGWGY